MNPDIRSLPSERRRELLLLGVLTLAALVVRLAFLGRAALWGDEILFTFRDASLSRSPLSIYWTMLNGFSQVTHLPFPLMVQNLLMRGLEGLSIAVDGNPFWQRLPAVLWGTASVPAVFWLVRRRLPCRVAWLATAWMAFGFFPVYYSREAYFYAPLIALSTLTFHGWLCGLESLAADKRLSKRSMAGFVLAATAMVHSHLTGLLFQSILCLASIVAALLPKRSGWKLPGAQTLAAISSIPLLLAAPFLYVWMAMGVQSGMEPGTPLSLIAWDVAGKFFLGHVAPLNAAGLLTMGVGFVSLARTGTPERPAPRWMAGLGVAMLLLLAVLARQSSYHVRYFCVLAPVLLVANSCGIARLAQFASTIPPFLRMGEPVLFRAFAIGIISLNLLILPLFWLPTVKSRDYQAVADWINSKVPPGGAYLWESAHELKFVSHNSQHSFFPTPDRLAMWPLVHQGPQELPELRRRQRALLERYPDVPWIDCRHGHRPGMEFGDWEWPRNFYGHVAMLENGSFRWQEYFRVAMPPLGRVPLNDKSIPIRFNTPADILAMDRKAERPGSLFYPGWFFASLHHDEFSEEYGRVHAGTNAVLKIISIGNAETLACLEARVAITARHPGRGTLEWFRGTELISSRTLPLGRSFRSIRSAPFLLPPGETVIELRAGTENPNEIGGIWLEYAKIVAGSHRASSK